jgi:energy-coupling factor transporter transmembrane protein EcfT
VAEARSAGITVLCSTHSLDDALGFDKVAVISAGRLAAFGTPTEVFEEWWDASWGLRLPWPVAFAEELKAHTPTLLGQAQRRGGEEGVPGTVSEEVPGTIPKKLRKKTELYRYRELPLPFLTSDGDAGEGKASAPLRRIKALVKLPLLIALAIVAIASPHWTISVGLTALTLLAGAVFGRVSPLYVLRGMLRSLPFLVIILILQTVFTWPDDTSRVLWRIGIVSVTSAELARSLSLILRLLAMMALLGLYIAVTPLRETLDAVKRLLAPLRRIGIPAGDIAMSIGITLRFVPVLREETERIVTAQLSRGSGKGPLRSAFSMIIPLFLRALERSEILAKAMLLRLYHSD